MTDKRMPILAADRPVKASPHDGRTAWPLGLGELLSAAYQAVEHNGQDFVILARRGGIGYAEGMSLLFDWYDRFERGQYVAFPPPEVKATGRDLDEFQQRIKYLTDAINQLKHERDAARAEAGECRSEAIHNKVQLLEARAEVERLRAVAWEQGNRADEAEAVVERLRAESELGSLVRRLPTAFSLLHHPLGWMVERVTEADGSTYRDALSADDDPAVAISEALGRHSETSDE